METEKLSPVEKLILEHRAATIAWSDRWDERAAAMQKWAVLEADRSSRRRPDPEIRAALGVLQKANIAFEDARAELIRIDNAINEARHEMAFQQRQAAAR